MGPPKPGSVASPSIRACTGDGVNPAPATAKRNAAPTGAAAVSPINKSTVPLSSASPSSTSEDPNDGPDDAPATGNGENTVSAANVGGNTSVIDANCGGTWELNGSAPTIKSPRPSPFMSGAAPTYVVAVEPAAVAARLIGRHVTGDRRNSRGVFVTSRIAQLHDPLVSAGVAIGTVTAAVPFAHVMGNEAGTTTTLPAHSPTGLSVGHSNSSTPVASSQFAGSLPTSVGLPPANRAADCGHAWRTAASGVPITCTTSGDESTATSREASTAASTVASLPASTVASIPASMPASGVVMGEVTSVTGAPASGSNTESAG
jgi:hypothetical protein